MSLLVKPKIQSLGAVVPGSVHELRRTHRGVQYLKQTGQFREYMQKAINDKRRPFIAWDGEGWSDAQGQHSYMLLQNSEGDYIAGPQLGSLECLSLILKVATATKGKAVHVIYGGGYDATHILRDAPLEIRKELAATGEAVWEIPKTLTGRANRYRFKYIPHKWLEISGFDWHHRKPSHIKIFDVMTFFQTSFIKALESRDIPVPEIIATGKASRADFTYEDVEEIKYYCQLELECLVMLCDKLRNEFDEAGIYVTQYHGPGAVASAVFKEYKIQDHKMEPPPHIEKISQRAYFGGRFEQFKAGHYEGKVYVYDIRSAYPDKIRNLPSLRGAYWRRTDDFHGQMGLWKCSYRDPDGDNTKPHPLPWRGPGAQVGFPAQNNEVWLWHHEARFATDVEYGYELHCPDPTLPFSYVEDMFNLRKQWKRQGFGGERALKLAMNSGYGKMAQRIGGSEKYNGRPKWHQLEWAGMVTSATRAQLWDAISLAPANIIAVETDSIASTVPLPLDLGEGLGQWELTEYDWITYIQSGIYFTSAGSVGHSKAKTRGIDVKQLDYGEVLRFLDSDQSDPLLVNSRMFIGLTNPRDYLYGQWTDSVKEVKVAGQKRLHLPSQCPACDNGLSMATHMHQLAAAPLYGHAPSEKHPLPWLDGPELPEEEMGYIGNDAVEDYDVERRKR